MSRRRRSPEARTRRALTIATVVGVLGLAVLGLLALTAQRGVPLIPTNDLDVQFADTKGITDYSEVRAAGKLVGQVLGSSYRDGVAHVHIRLNGNLGSVRSDTTARIRLKGVLGAKFVELVPGTRGRTLPNGAVIPTQRTSTTVDLFDVISTLDARRRRDLRAALDALGRGFAGRGGPLNTALGKLPSLTDDIDATARAVNARAGAAARLVPSVESLAAAFDAVRDELALSLKPTADALAPFAERQPRVASTLVEAPTTLAALRTGLARTDPLLRETTGFAQQARRLVAVAPPALKNTTTLLRVTRKPLADTRRLLSAIRPAVAPTLRFARATRPLAEPLTRLLGNTTPALDSLASRGCDLLGMLRNWRSLTSIGTPPESEIGLSNVVRTALANVDPNIVYGVAHTTGKLGHNAYPAPCEQTGTRLP